MGYSVISAIIFFSSQKCSLTPVSDGESERVVSRTEGPFSTSTLAVVWKVDGMGEMRQAAPSGACSVVWEKDGM